MRLYVPIRPMPAPRPRFGDHAYNVAPYRVWKRQVAMAAGSGLGKRVGDPNPHWMVTILLHEWDRRADLDMAERIVLLANGRVAEDGTHEELVAAGGRYATLYDLQASHYRLTGTLE